MQGNSCLQRFNSKKKVKKIILKKYYVLPFSVLDKLQETTYYIIRNSVRLQVHDALWVYCFW